MDSTTKPANLIKIDYTDRTHVEIANRVISLGMQHIGSWDVRFRYAEAKQPEFSLFLEAPVNDEEQLISNIVFENFNLKDLYKRSSMNVSNALIYRALTDLVKACFQIQTRSLAPAGSSGMRSGALQLEMVAQNRAFSVQIAASQKLLQLFERSAVIRLGIQPTRTDLIKRHKLSLSVLHHWDSVTYTELTSWSNGDFLAICPFSEFTGDGIRLSAVDEQGFPFAELLFSAHRTKVISLGGRITGPSGAVKATGPVLQAIAINSESMTHEDTMQDTNQLAAAKKVESASQSTDTPNKKILESKVSLPVTIHLGQTRMTIEQLQSLSIGQAVDFSTSTTADIFVYAGDNKVAAGRLCEVNGNFGVIIRQLFI